MGLRVVLITRFGPIGPGVAYGAKFQGNLLNFPAEQMSVDADEPEHFLEWGRAHGIRHGDFVARRLFAVTDPKTPPRVRACMACKTFPATRPLKENADYRR
jgi:uncharacterized NAD(P)/FAD-binding protein YdhS